MQVYNITPYMRYHPGGVSILMKAAGKDGTALFRKYHAWVNGHALLEKCLLGTLEPPGDSAPAAGAAGTAAAGGSTCAAS